MDELPFNQRYPWYRYQETIEDEGKLGRRVWWVARGAGQDFGCIVEEVPASGEPLSVRSRNVLVPGDEDYVEIDPDTIEKGSGWAGMRNAPIPVQWTILEQVLLPLLRLFQWFGDEWRAAPRPTPSMPPVRAQAGGPHNKRKRKEKDAGASLPPPRVDDYTVGVTLGRSLMEQHPRETRLTSKSPVPQLGGPVRRGRRFDLPPDAFGRK